MKEIVLIAHNLRSCHNVGSLLRTAEGLGVAQVILSGYTPYPMSDNDRRMPHETRKIHKQITKTALGAEEYVTWRHEPDVHKSIADLRNDGFSVFAVEQTPDSIELPAFKAPEKVALLVGREVDGVEPEIIALCDNSLEIPMLGRKESFNVVQAAAMALYHCTFN